MRNALLITAATLITIGIAFVYWPIAFIAAGLFLGAFVLLTEE